MEIATVGAVSPGQHSALQQDFVCIDMPPNSKPAPENVNLFGSTSMLSVGLSFNSERSPQGLAVKAKSELESGSLNIVEAAILALGGLQKPPSKTERSSLARSSSLTRQVEAFSRAKSMPSSHIRLLNSNSTNESYIALNSNGVEDTHHVFHSRSVPVSYSDGTIRENQVRVLRVVPSQGTPQRDITLTNAPTIRNGEEHQDDITEEEAICRLCFEELGEELESCKLECNCKGDLSLVHRECCQRWFGLRGVSTCEICMAEVRNISVRVTRRPAVNLNSSQNLLQVHQPPPELQPPPVLQPSPVIDTNRLFQEIPFLVVGSIVGYFIAIKFFQMGRRNNDAIHDIYGIPASCILGVLTSFTASYFAQEPLMWIYALAQYTIFLVCSQIFYNVLHMKTISTIIFAAAIAMGISRGVRPLYRTIMKLRQVWRNQLQLSNNAEDGSLPSEAQPAQVTAESH